MGISHHELAVRFKAWAFLGFCQHVCLQYFALIVFQLDYMSVDLFDHIVNARQEVFAPFVIPGELLRQCDQGLVINVERCGINLWVSQFVQKVSKVDDVFGCFTGCMQFCFR